MKRGALASTSRPGRLPYLPFYVDDWLLSDAVTGFTLEQEAVYLRLLLRQWKAPDGKLPKDEQLLAAHTKLGPRWSKVGRPILERCFAKQPGGGYVNVRLQREWKIAQAKHKQTSAAARARWTQKVSGNGSKR